MPLTLISVSNLSYPLHPTEPNLAQLFVRTPVPALPKIARLRAEISFHAASHRQMERQVGCDANVQQEPPPVELQAREALVREVEHGDDEDRPKQRHPEEG